MKVNAVNSVDTALPATTAVLGTWTPAAGSATPVAALNSVQQVTPLSAYAFDPEIYSEVSINNSVRNSSRYGKRTPVSHTSREPVSPVCRIFSLGFFI